MAAAEITTGHQRSVGTSGRGTNAFIRNRIELHAAATQDKLISNGPGGICASSNFSCRHRVRSSLECLSVPLLSAVAVYAAFHVCVSVFLVSMLDSSKSIVCVVSAL